MKRLLFLLPLSLLAGCRQERLATEADRPPLAVPTPKTSDVGDIGDLRLTPSATVKPTLQPDQVAIDRLQPAQGHLEPGVLVYSKYGFLMGRVIKIDPDHTLPSGAQGGVLFSEDDNPKEAPIWWFFKYFDDARVLK